MLNNPLKRDELVKAQQRELWREAERARHTRRLPMRTQVRLALVCVPLPVLAACGSTTAANPSPTATQPTQTPATSLTVYTSPDHKYRISYHTGWQEQTVDGNPGKVSFTGPNGQEFEVNDNASTPGGDPATVLIVEVVTYKGAVYQIDYASPGASFQADDTTFYTPMEQSFQFLT